MGSHILIIVGRADGARANTRPAGGRGSAGRSVRL